MAQDIGLKDIRFEGARQNLLNAIEIEYEGRKIVLEGTAYRDNIVRQAAMSSTLDGLRRGIPCG